MLPGIKIIRSRWTKWLGNWIHLVENPAQIIHTEAFETDDALYSKSVEQLRFGNITKTTLAGRHRNTDEILCRLCSGINDLVVLDIGASDGITSLDLFRKLDDQIRTLYITDYNLWINWRKAHGHYYFYDRRNEKCIGISNRFFLMDPERISRWLPWKRNNTRHNNNLPDDTEELLIIHPKVHDLSRRDDRVRILEFNLFDEWKQEKPHLIKVANVLKPGYFTKAEFETGLQNLRNIVRDGGIIAIIHNLEGKERSTILKRQGDKLVEMEKVHGGLEFVTSFCDSQ